MKYTVDTAKEYEKGGKGFSFGGNQISLWYDEGGMDFAAGEFAHPAVIVDCNHANSGKKFFEQIRIAKEVLANARGNSAIGKLVKGLMIESYIEDGCQKSGENIYGCSITDPCLGWEKTERLILDLADLK